MKSPKNSGISALIALDKPKGMSSHDCVARARRILGIKRIGHAGTLDPDATGVLVLGVGSATKLMGLLTQDVKAYRAHISFGVQTTTDDAQGEVLRTADVPKQLLDEEFAKNYVASLVGKHMQVPPQFSAIFVNGKRAYKAAREGLFVELEPRSTEIYEAHFKRAVSVEPLVWECDFSVSKGTYIRSIARDMGKALDTAAHISELERTASGLITQHMCVSFEVLEAVGLNNLERIAINPLQVATYDGYKVLNDAELEDVRCGRKLSLRGVQGDSHPGAQIALIKDDKLFGLWEADMRGLKSKVNFTGGISGAYCD